MGEGSGKRQGKNQRGDGRGKGAARRPMGANGGRSAAQAREKKRCSDAKGRRGWERAEFQGYAWAVRKRREARMRGRTGKKVTGVGEVGGTWSPSLLSRTPSGSERFRDKRDVKGVRAASVAGAQRGRQKARWHVAWGTWRTQPQGEEEGERARACRGRNARELAVRRKRPENEATGRSLKQSELRTGASSSPQR